MIADVSADQDFVARAGAAGGDFGWSFDNAYASGCDEDLVALAAIDDLGVTGDELHAGFKRGITHGFHHALQFFGRQALFENERRRQVQRTSTAHGEIVDRAVDCQPADVAAGEKNRSDYERIGGESQARTVDIEDGLVIKLV